MRTALAIVAALALAGAAAGCGEKTSVTVYKQGQYQGKPDQQPWDAGQSPTSQPNQWPNGDKAAWERAIKARNLAQNEYVRGGRTPNSN